MLHRRSVALVAFALLPIVPGGARAQGAESFAIPNNGASSLPMGTTKGERYKRLVVRGFIGIALFGRSQVWLRAP